TGRGRDIWLGHDEFYFLGLYPWEAEPLSTTTHIQTRVVSMDNTNPWAKAGLMIREKLTPYSRYAAVFVTPGNGITFQWRTVEGGPSGSAGETSRTVPQYLKLERTAIGSYIASYSTTGLSWDWADVNVSENPDVTYMDVPMDDPCLYAGVAVTSHDAAQLCVADFNNWDAYPWPSTWVWGDVGLNDPEQLYVALEDTIGNISVVEHSDVNAATLTSWQEWNIDLSDFAVNLNAVKKVRIGLGDRDIQPGGGTGALYIDDVRACPPRCIPAYAKPPADIAVPYDCIVDEKDLQVFAGDWLDKTEFQDWDHRAAYWDPCYPTAWADVAVTEAVRDYFALNGYTVVDANGLKAWMDARIADQTLSVVVLCKDVVPDTVAETQDPNCTIRKYLDAGGKVVFYSDIPFYYQGHADGTSTTWNVDGSINTLGFNVASAAWDAHPTTITYHGLNWGLTQTWSSVRPTLPGDVDTIMATTDIGNAASWAKHYLPGDIFRGFVRYADFDVTTSSPVGLIEDLLRVAEYRGALGTDWHADGVINFQDYTIFANQYLDELLWP
ncbi:MAG: hypothetical protein ACYSUY_20270, partial [Planctomycetota bacterium]